MAYNYTTDDMRSTGNQLLSIKNSVGEQIAAAQQAITNLIGSGFATEAASGAYQDQFNQLNTSLTDLNNSLEPMGNFLIQYAQSVEDMDNQMASAMNS
jgi:uncharacterized protein YukE